MKYGLYLLINVDVIDNYYRWVLFILVGRIYTCLLPYNMFFRKK